MAEKEKKCFICGKIYSYCPHCKDANPEESWKILFHDEKCRDISRIWYAYRGKEITKEEAKESMSVLKPNIDDTLNYDSVPAKEIQEIFGVNKGVVVDDVPSLEGKPEENEGKTQNSNKQNPKKNNKKQVSDQ